MKALVLFASVSLFAVPAFADAHLDADTIAKIEAYLASVECQMDSDDIEVADDGYDMDDVIFKGGNQLDIQLDLDLNAVSLCAD